MEDKCGTCGNNAPSGRMYLLDFETVYCSQECLNVAARRIKDQIADLQQRLEAWRNYHKNNAHYDQLLHEGPSFRKLQALGELP